MCIRDSFKTNSFGMRSAELAEKQPGETRIAVFGDSVVNGGSKIGHDELATSIIQSEIADSVVCNISAGSWDPGNWLAYAREYGFHGADQVVLVISSHDAHDVPTFRPLEAYAHPTKRSFALVEVFHKIKQRLLPAIAVDVVEGAALEMLVAFLCLANDEGRRVHVCQHLGRAEHDSPEIGYYLIKAACKDAGVEPVSLGPAFHAHPEGYADSLHPSVAGQRILAQEIIKLVRSTL